MVSEVLHTLLSLQRRFRTDTPPIVFPIQRSTSGARQAAVAILVTAEDDPRLLLTRRTSNIGFSSQMSFPGGSREADESPIETAQRETREEVGLVIPDSSLIGSITKEPTRRGIYSVMSILAFWDGELTQVTPQRTEVASVHSIPLSDFANPANRATFQRGAHRGPMFFVDNVTVWGMTAQLIDTLLDTLHAQQPWDHTRVEPVPEDFR
ncbi:MAG: CoA pyrophosphatase [Actinomycetaceae bacterium]|nr:CoA pyrophosphatase [Actinomycetaceae bacterium]MDY6083207.1 CoA pyrophosphatase [Actinomycetaceae bacterium]